MKIAITGCAGFIGSHFSLYILEKYPDATVVGIDFLTYASKKYGPDIISVPLLTSAAAAYCDMGDYVRARQCCNRAYFHSNKNPSNELRMVYKRIESEENK